MADWSASSDTVEQPYYHLEQSIKEMSQILMINLLLMTMTMIFRADASPCCLEGMACCARHNNELEPLLDHDALQRRYRYYPPETMSEAYKVIDSHLGQHVDTDHAEQNLDEVTCLLRCEVAADSARGLSRLCGLTPGLAGRLRSKDRSLMINSMMRLLELENVLTVNMACSVYSTRELLENNLIAGDPIGRLNRGEPNLFPRLDKVVVGVALRRATNCIEEYAIQLEHVTKSQNHNLGIVKMFWNKILDGRLKEEHPAQFIDLVFLLDPEGTLNTVKDMEYAIDGKEIGLILEFLNKQDKITPMSKRDSDWRVTAYEKYLDRPCLMYDSMIYHLIESLNFDLRLKRFIDKQIIDRIERNHEIAKHRAYFHMCKKLIKEKYRFVHFINQETSIQ